MTQHNGRCMSLCRLIAVALLLAGCRTKPPATATVTPDAPKLTEGVEKPDYLRNARPVKPEAYASFCEGLMNIQKQQWAEAAQWFEKGLTFDPQSELLHHYLLICYHKLGQRDKLLGQLKRISDLKPDDFDTHLRLGKLYEEEKMPEDALREYDLALKAAKSDTPANALTAVLDAVARLCMEKKDFKRAEECYLRMLKVQPGANEAAIRYRLGEMHFQNKDWKRAAEELEKVRAKTPNVLRAIWHLAICYEEMKDHEKAISVVKGFLAANPQAQENWLLHSVLGGLYERTMQHDQAKSERQIAIGILQKLIDDGSKEVEVHRYLASLLRTEKRYDEALRLVNKAMSLPSDDDMAARRLHFLLAEIYYDTQQDELCEKELRKALEYDPDSPELNNFLGYFYAERGKHLDEAERLIEKALKAKPDNGAYLDSLGWVWYRQAMQDNDPAKVKRALDKLKEASSKYDDPVIREHIGDVYHGMGDLDKAEVEWRKSLQLWERRPNEPPGPDGVRHKLEQLLKLKPAGKKDEK